MNEEKLFDVTQDYDEDDTFTDDEETESNNNNNNINEVVIIRPIPKRVKLMSFKETCDELDRLLSNTSHTCHKCFKEFEHKYQLDEHLPIHNNEIDNIVCICKRCKQIYNSDSEYILHECPGNKEGATVQSVEDGKEICPVCNKRFINQFCLGEHFIEAHNDYDQLKVLDEKVVQGFPGFELLEKIGMIKKDDSINGECMICHFGYEINDDIDDMDDDNKNSLVMLCCERPICCSCLMHCLSINNNLICPFCLKDNVRDDLDYIVYIDEVNVTCRDKWIPWWSDHLDIFN